MPDRLRPIALGAAAALGVLLVLVVRACGDDDPPAPTVPVPPAVEAEPFPDPFAWDADDEEELTERAAAGHAHGLYAFSPGGILVSAVRTARWRERVEATADAAGVDADTLEGLILLESAGREDAITAAGVEGAVGLTQIVAGTATQLLGMEVDVAESKRLTRRIERAVRRLRLGEAERLRERRRRVDDRFDPDKALAATARYLKIALERYGREDLAFVSYHMGMGNLDGVLAAFGGEDASWAQVYFDSTPLRHPAAYERLSSFQDDSQNYLWKVLAAREVMRLHRDDPEELARRNALQLAKGSSEEVLHPLGSTPVFEDPDALRAAWDADEIVAVPDRPRVTGLVRDRDMGELARRVGAEPALYRGLRPEALALALYLTSQVRAIAGTDAYLRITSGVRDRRYQQALSARNAEATRRYSLHTTGWALDIARDYRDRRHALAFQFVLDRLRALDLIAWVREPRAIHLTVSRDAEQLLPLLDRLDTAP